VSLDPKTLLPLCILSMYILILTINGFSDAINLLTSSVYLWFEQLWYWSVKHDTWQTSATYCRNKLKCRCCFCFLSHICFCSHYWFSVSFVTCKRKIHSCLTWKNYRKICKNVWWYITGRHNSMCKNEWIFSLHVTSISAKINVLYKYKCTQYWLFAVNIYLLLKSVSEKLIQLDKTKTF